MAVMGGNASIQALGITHRNKRESRPLGVPSSEGKAGFYVSKNAHSQSPTFVAITGPRRDIVTERSQPNRKPF
jgi:hypothetical protein